MKILVVEDEPKTGNYLKQGLAEAGFVVDLARDGEDGLHDALTVNYDLVILDVMLPGMDGWGVLRGIRSSGKEVPVLFLTARDQVDDRVRGLELGADDYLVKPFALVELMARLEAVCRRTVIRPPAVMVAGTLSLDLATRRVTREQSELELTPTEFSILELLMRHSGQVVTRRMLCEHLWETDWEGATNVIEVHINRLRGKLDKGFTESVIQTVRGRGYALRAV